MLIQKFLPTASKRMLCIEMTATLLEAARLLDDGSDMLLVSDVEGRMAGILTKTDVVRQTGRCAGASCTAPVVEAMTRDVITAEPEGQLHDAWEVMKTSGFKNVPILDSDGKPLGVLNARDVLQMLLQEIQQEENLLRDYVMNIGYR
ncbi:MAG TPA: CBS domain-containing protein [Aurantimonas coralicida]|uniref:CBS domain-containing protein n=2 Tax=root TaxID=1 RepID=A0A9C9TFZ1_9HYPH|nr:CBS domain-containing protein [Aurantimonas coralicida]HET99568.1 CBS domain-containing protein [Aurantimonas coralicida]